MSRSLNYVGLKRAIVTKHLGIPHSPSLNAVCRMKGRETTIDGRHGEGGGQILRTALTLSALCNVPVKVDHIRANRKNPGLRPQHLVAVHALETITGAKVDGARVDSTELLFEPRGVRGGNYRFHIGTAGSTGLVLQALIPVLLFGNTRSHVQITGGTHVPWSPPFHYLQSVFSPALKAMGGEVHLEISRWGWYPKGGGIVRASVYPTRGLKAIQHIQRGELMDIQVLSAVSNLPLHIAERQRDRALKRLKYLGITPHTSIENAPSPGQGTALFLAAQFEGITAGFTSLGKRGKKAEAVADDACDELIGFLDGGAAIDRHLADQLVLYMALAKGYSTFLTEKATEHLLTNIWVIEQFLPLTFEVEGKTGQIGVQGSGFALA
jgi:RNA 3'-terminal phosphate cyclase (ATP)